MDQLQQIHRAVNKQHLKITLLTFFAIAWLIPDSRWAITGALGFEPFYRGKPSSYWQEVYRAREAGNQGKPLLSRGWNDNWLTTAVGYSVVSNPALELQNLLHRDDGEAVPVLMELLKEGDDKMRRSAVLALGRRRARAKAAVPQLISLHDQKAIEDDPFGRAMHQIDPEKAKRLGIPEPQWSDPLPQEDWKYY
ncbi:MAG TPA: hypothetical protein VKI65_06290 [Gemmataceae bacterium]|nr:hypothetical protein [Gemmataceae bacterium]